MNNRRKLVLALGAGALISPFASFSQQQSKLWRIGFLGLGNAINTSSRVEALRNGMRELGYVEEKHFVFDFRWAEGNYVRLPSLAVELVDLKVDVIVTHGSPGTHAAKNATGTIPIVMAAGGDPVAEGIVASFARPGGNITGGTFFSPQISAKRIELLKDALPRLTQVAVLLHERADAISVNAILQLMESLATTRKIALHKFTTQGIGDFENAFAAMAKQRVGAVVIPEILALTINPKEIAELAAKHRLPVAGNTELAQAGGMLGYGVNILEMFRRAAYLIDRILNGTKPADLPIEQATKFDLVANIRTAKVLGIKIPQSILVRADKVIE